MKELTLKNHLIKYLVSFFVAFLIISSISYYSINVIIKNRLTKHVLFATQNFTNSIIENLKYTNDITNFKATIPILEKFFLFDTKISLYTNNFLPLDSSFEKLSVKEKNVLLKLKNRDKNINIFYNSKLSYYFYLNLSTSNYYKITFDFSTYFNLKYLLLGMFSFLGFILVFLYFLLYKFFFNKMIFPFIILSYNMKNFSQTKIFIEDNSLQKSNIKELNIIIDSYQSMGDEITSSLEEMTAMNDSLIESFNNVEEVSNKLEQIISLSSKLTSESTKKDSTFLSDVLHIAKDILPESDYGAIFTVENGKWIYQDSIGHDLKILQSLDLKEEYLVTPDEPTVIYDLNKFENRDFPEDIAKKFVEATKPVKSTILHPLKIDDEVIGGIALDIAKDSNKEFSPQSFKIFNAFGNLITAFLVNHKYIEEKDDFQKDLIISIINLLEIHDKYTKGHSENVALLSRKIAIKMNLPEYEIKKIYWTGLIHDIGKIVIDNKILNKPGKLTDEEFEIIKKHPEFGYQTLQHSEKLKDMATNIRAHHERFDGKGYPLGLKGYKIPLIARIICVADTWDAMTSNRSYRKPLPREVALTEIIKNSGTQFDPEIVDAFLELIETHEIR